MVVLIFLQTVPVYQQHSRLVPDALVTDQVGMPAVRSHRDTPGWKCLIRGSVG